MVKKFQDYQPGDIIYSPFIMEPYLILKTPHKTGYDCLSLKTFKRDRYICDSNKNCWNKYEE